jgi:hypothetical protein
MIEMTCAACGEASPEPPDAFTAERLMAGIRDAAVRFDPDNAASYRAMGPEHVREAVRLSTRLLLAHREYQRRFRITRRGRRQHAQTIYRYLDVLPIQYTVVSAAWALLATAVLDPPEPDPSQRSPLRTDNGRGAGGETTPQPPRTVADTAADPPQG